MRKKLSKVMALICVATITVTSMPYLSDSTKGATMDFSAENSSVMVDKGGYKKEVYGVGTDDWGVTWTDRKNNLPTRTTYLTDNYKETVGTVPTNDWASSVVFDKYSESLYAHPLAYRAASNGMQMASPAVTSGTSYVDGEPTVESLLEDNTVELVVGGNNFSAKDAKVDKTTDWTYDILMENNASTSSIMATIGKGTPYAYYTFKNVEPTISLGAGGTDLAIYKNSTSSNILGVSLKNRKDGKTHYYLISAPSGTTWVNADGKLTAKMPAGKNYMSVAILPDGSDNAFELYKKYAFNFITDTKVEWKYLKNSSKVVTKYNVITKNMETGANGGDTIIALYPHQWRYTNSKFTGYTYETIRGTMKTVVGTNYSTTMQYNGILSSLPVTKDEETVGKIKDQLGYLYSYRKSKDNPYRDYYIWKDPVNGKEPNNWGGVFGGSAWEYDPQTQMYYLHLFSKKQPDLNWENEKVRQEVYDMMKFWCEKGIDGFRMDVISMISKDQRFPDGEMNNGLYGDFGPYCVHGPRIHEFLQEMNREVLSKYDIMTVGETAGVTIEEAQKYAGDDRNELNMVFQFEHVESGCGDYGKWTTAKYDFKEFKNIMIKWQEELQGKAWNSLFLGNHDQPRSVSRFGNDNPVYRETSAKMLATCIHMMQGTPYVYQGEELGMTNIYFDKLEDYRDIESINYFEEFTESGLMTPEHMMKCLMLRSRDNARTPMQWDDSKQAGFTEGEPWIKVNPNYKKINAAQQLEDPDSVFHYYQKLIRLRKEKDIIVYGEFEPLYREDEQIFAYTRKQDQEKLLTVCNFSDKNAEVEVPEEFKGAECLITNLGRKEFEGKIVLNPYEAFVLYYKH